MINDCKCGSEVNEELRDGSKMFCGNEDVPLAREFCCSVSQPVRRSHVAFAQILKGAKKKIDLP